LRVNWTLLCIRFREAISARWNRSHTGWEWCGATRTRSATEGKKSGTAWIGL
jgi:hypothetical protein